VAAIQDPGNLPGVLGLRAHAAGAGGDGKKNKGESQALDRAGSQRSPAGQRKKTNARPLMRESAAIWRGDRPQGSPAKQLAFRAPRPVGIN